MASDLARNVGEHVPAVEFRSTFAWVTIGLLGCTDASSSANCATRAPASDLVAFYEPRSDVIVDPTSGDATLTGSADASFDWALIADEDGVITGKPSLDQVLRYDRDAMLGAASSQSIDGPLALERFGASVARLDTRIVVGAPNATPTPARVGAGAVYLSPGFSTPDTRILGEEAEDHLGELVAACGDLDGDGIRDFAASAAWADDLRGAVYVGSSALSGEVEAANLTRIPALPSQAELEAGGFAQSQFGRAILCNADFVGTSAVDLVVGAPFGSLAETGPGTVYVYASVSSGNAMVELSGDEPTDAFGAALARGDIDGDGADDLVVGAPGTLGGNGSVFVYLASAFDPASMGYLQPSAELRSGTVGARFGTTVVVEDLDGDGLDEVIVGAPAYNPVPEATGTIQAGAVWIFTGAGLAGGVAEPIYTNGASQGFLGESGCLRTGERLAAPDLDADGLSDLVLLEGATSD